jgi:hypothetical protein
MSPLIYGLSGVLSLVPSSGIEKNTPLRGEALITLLCQHGKGFFSIGGKSDNAGIIISVLAGF